MSDGPHNVDVYVGARIRARRKERGVSQGSLAAALGITFQQVQKYERGMNRVSASKLFEIAGIFDTPIQWFFDGLDQSAPAATAEAVLAGAAFAATSEGLEIIRSFPTLTRSERSAVVALLRSLARERGA